MPTPGIIEDHYHTTGDRNTDRKNIDLYFEKLNFYLEVLPIGKYVEHSNKSSIFQCHGTNFDGTVGHKSTVPGRENTFELMIGKFELHT